MNASFVRYRSRIYVGVNAAVLFVCCVGTMTGGGSFGTAAYVSSLFAVCSAPVLFLDAFNGRYSLLAIFTGLYFVFFGQLDLMSLLFGESGATGTGFLSEAECALVCGAVMVVIGYRAGVAFGTRKISGQAPPDWPGGSMLAVGSLMWLAGSAAILYFQVFAVPEKSIAATAKGFASLGPAWTFALMLGQMIEPLGLVIVAYGYARYRSTTWLALTLTMVIAQVALGFVADIKSLAMLGGILVVLARTLVDNKLPKAWIIGGALFLAFAFPMFQAYRADVAGGRGLNRQQAFQNIEKVLEIVLANRDKVTERSADERSQTFFQRASLKGNVELAFAHTGIDTPFQGGRTLIGIPGAFIPRLIWPDKPDVSAGTLFNKVFIRIGQDDTNISPSHVGELYWNFGWAGVVLGMAFIGMLLGFIGSRYNLADGISVTRLLILLATVKYVCLGSEGVLAVAYVLWLRSMGAIGLLHLMLARPQRQPQPLASPGAGRAIASLPQDIKSTGNASPPALPVVRFPNMMR